MSLRYEGKPRYALARWLSWAARCRIPEFTKLGKKIRSHLETIHATLDHGLSNEWASHCTSLLVFGLSECGAAVPAGCCWF